MLIVHSHADLMQLVERCDGFRPEFDGMINVDSELDTQVIERGKKLEQRLAHALGRLERYSSSDAHDADIRGVLGELLECVSQQRHHHQGISAGNEDLVDIIPLLRRAYVSGREGNIIALHGASRILSAQTPAAMRCADG